MSNMELPKLTPNTSIRKKKKILLMSDDIRIPSGVGTMSRAMVFGTIHKYDWCQIAGAVKHPDAGKIADTSEDIKKQTGVEDAYCRLYPSNGYGDENLLRQVLDLEKPDAILHFTDPRFWGFLYNMEHEIRQNIPLMYLNIWDDLPFPHWNENAYESCDLLMAISKQTYGINKNVCTRKPRIENKDLFYVPHGIDERIYKPIDKTEKTFTELKERLTGGKDFNFIALFNSRNIHRKRPSDLILGFKKLCESLPKEDAKRCLLVLHTDPVDQNGTDLPATVQALAPECNVAFSTQKISYPELNNLYNLADVTCNPSSAEGFGLSHMESLMAGTPTIATVVGGLQDQMGFTVDGKDVTVNNFTSEIPSNSTGEISKEHGEWTYPLWPQMNLQGSPNTPYIYDSRVSVDQIAEGLKFWYHLGPEERQRRGKVGREWSIKNGFTQKGMCDATMNAIDTCFKEFKPRDRYTIINTLDEQPSKKAGILI